MDCQAGQKNAFGREPVRQMICLCNQSAYMYWEFRLSQEPKRLWERYLANNPLFVYYLILQKMGWKKFGDAYLAGVEPDA